MVDISEKLDEVLGLNEAEGHTTKGAGQATKRPSFGNFRGSNDAKKQGKNSPSPPQES